MASSQPLASSPVVGGRGPMGQGQGGTTPSLLEVLAAATGLRIAIVDIDAHTGNGTQASVERPLPSPSFSICPSLPIRYRPGF